MGKRQQLLFELISKEPTEGKTDFLLSAKHPPVFGEQSTDVARTSKFFIVNSFTITIGITILLVVFFCGYIVGYKVGKSSQVAQRSRAQLAQIQSQPPQQSVLNVKIKKPNVSTVPPVGRTTVQNKVSSPTISEKSSGTQKLKITREKGLNYLIIQLFKNYEDAENAHRFLTEKGIKATIEKLNRWYALTSVAGFNFRDPAERKRAEEFRSQIKALGRLYRRRKDAKGVDFQTCFYRKWR